MDKETVGLIVAALGGRITTAHGVVSICGLTQSEEEVLDILGIDLEQLDLDERIELFRYDSMVGDKVLRKLLVDSDYWQKADCPTLDMARVIRDELQDRPGALLLHDIVAKGDWELWLKTGPEYPVYQSLRRRRNIKVIGAEPSPGKPLCAILVRDTSEPYSIHWDFGWFDGVNWNSFQSGLITGLTKEVAYSVELPNAGEEAWNR